MARNMRRQDPPPADSQLPDNVWCDGLLVAGVDAAAPWRARIRALNTARQAMERPAPARPRFRFGPGGPRVEDDDQDGEPPGGGGVTRPDGPVLQQQHL
jgi:hypothetical protein